jgi:L-lactate dehydrogenase complex protein LldG
MTDFLKEADTAQNQEDFLNRIAKAADRPRHALADNPLEPVNDLPETTLAGKSQDELLEIAKKNSEAVHVNFKVVKKADLGTTLDEFISEKDVNSLMLPSFAEEKWTDYSLNMWHQGLAIDPVYYWKPELGRENITNANKSDAAIGFADFLLAESGTITIATYPEQGRSFHFLPTHYLAIIPKSKILPRSRQAMDYYEKEIQAGNLATSNINFITGPSNSGDIEMVLIVGVHGPLDMEYVVVEDM